MMRINFVIFLILITCFSYAAAKTVRGAIVDYDTNEPIEFCNVIEKNTQNGVLSDENGNFEISLQHKKADVKLIVQTIGYISDTISVKNKLNLGIIYLKSSSTNLDEIIVTGTTRSSLIRESPIAITAISPIQD